MTKIKIAFQGEKGAYSHLACEEIFKGADIQNCATFEETFKLAFDDENYKVTWFIQSNTEEQAINMKRHIDFMASKTHKGKTPRAWDKLFLMEAYFAQHHNYEVTVTINDNNIVEVHKDSDNACSFEATKAHANAVSGDFFATGNTHTDYSYAAEDLLTQEICAEYRDDIEEFIENNGWFSTSKAFIKAILCLYAKKKPKSFDNNLDVIMDNSWLKIASSKNYHHYFPKSWLKKNYKDWDYFYVNHILNITIVDDFLNKRTIKTKSPANYMKTFEKENEDLKK